MRFSALNTTAVNQVKNKDDNFCELRSELTSWLEKPDKKSLGIVVRNLPYSCPDKDECSREVFNECYRAIHLRRTDEPIINQEHYLARVLKNATMFHARKCSSCKGVSIDDPENQVVVSPILEGGYSLDKDYETNILLEEFVKTLNHEEIALLELLYEGNTSGEIYALWSEKSPGITPDAFRKRLQRFREKFQSFLDNRDYKK
jgi:hypothetical protein